MCGLGLCCLLLGGCADTASQAQNVYIVRPQDTLYSIAWRYGLDFHELARWNHIGADYHITVGQSLVLARDGRAPAARNSPNVARQSPIKTAAPPGSAEVPHAPLPLSALKWTWPTDRLSAPRPVQGGGILLAGRLGQDVRAACAGRVVYTGNGIRGYGNLIIIKHGENLLSSYAHNRESLVHDGEEVAMGQIIGHMGEGAPETPVLYFEIRRNGKPVDPVPFLPLMK
jgi:lipoprotein NlpD